MAVNLNPPNDVAELKEFVVVHARAQGIPRRVYEAVLGRVVHDDDGPGGWAYEWSDEARRRENEGDPLAACRLSIMARFPYVNGPARAEALRRATEALDRWRRDAAPALEPLDVELPGGRVRCWTTGLTSRERADPKPLVLVMGGIVSTKEQWAPALLRLRRLGLAGVATEMPGAGENTLRYDAGSWRMISGLLDALADRADTRRTYAMAMSFSGHLALRCALEDPRIRGVLTVGAPVSGPFEDPAWQRLLPRVTVDTIGHLAGVKPPEVAGHLRGWGLTPERLRALDVPVAYVASRRDEIIPAADIDLLRRNARRLALCEFDDVHASPRYVDVTGLWLTRALLRMGRTAPAGRAALSALIPLLRARHKLSGPR